MFFPNYIESTFEETKCYVIRKLTFDKIWVHIYGNAKKIAKRS
jgi:hypothetical protein